ncbi:fimbria/pilus outer membrane usher protein [Providencia rettgeri]
MMKKKNKMRLYPVLMGVSVYTGASGVLAKDYFDPNLLALSNGQTEIADLSFYETSGQIPPGTYSITLLVNGSDKGQYVISFKPNPQGVVEPEMTPALLNKVGIDTEHLPAFQGLAVDKPINDLKQLIPDASWSFDFPTLSFKLSIPQIAMQPAVRNYVDPELWDQGIPAFMMNYSFNGGRNWRDSGKYTPSSEQTNLYANIRSGLNWQAWRLRSDMVYSRNENATKGQGTKTNQRTQFNNTYVARDIQPWRSEILMGENSSGNDVFDSIPFRGVKLNSNEEMLPNSLRGFAPVISGVAQSNARITVTQNGNIVYQTFVAPGPYRIDDLYPSGQGGELTATITEADGTVRTQDIAYSSLPIMQRPGGFKYEVTAGRYNGNITHGSRESDFALATLVYGLPYDITLYGGSLQAQDYMSFVGGVGLSLGDFGAISSDITTSRANVKAQTNTQSGNSYRLRYSKSLLSTGTSIDLAAYRYSTQNYYSFADFNNTGYQLNEDQVPWRQYHQRSNFQVRVNQNLRNYGSLYLSASRQDYWNNGQTNDQLSAGYNSSLYGVNYSLNYSIDRIKQDNSWPENRQFSLNLQVPFSLFTSTGSLSNSYANYQMSHNSQGDVQQQIGLSGSTLDNRLSYNLSHGHSNRDIDDTSTLNLGYQGSKGSANMGYSYSNQYRSLNMSANGGAIVHSEGIVFGQTIGNSAALVSAPDTSGTSIMSGNIKTDSQGYALVPYLSNYQKNSINLNPATLPEDVDITQSSVNVYPTKGAIVRANFNTRVGYQALITLKHRGQLLPFGAVVTVEDSTHENGTGIVGDAGQVYLNGLKDSGILSVKWGNSASQQCQSAFNFAAMGDAIASQSIKTFSLDCGGGK